MSLPPSLRELLPFGLRVGVRRLPAVLRAGMRGLIGESVQRSPEPYGHQLSTRRSPMRRQGTLYEEAKQEAKEHNVGRVAELLDGVVIPPGQVFSWHRTVGPPLRLNGFVPGPELHDGRMAMGGGGGACQAANLLFYLGAVGGLEVLERHRHGLDLFPDDDRSLPFGCGATVFYPHRDLRLKNPLSEPVRIQMWVEGPWLQGSLSTPTDPGQRFELRERGHRFVRRADGIWRENTLLRVNAQGEQTVLVTNSARVTYPLPADAQVLESP